MTNARTFALQVNLNNGTSEEIHIRKLPMSKIDELSEVWGDYSKEAAFYSGKPMEFVQELDDASFAAVVDKGRELNADNFRKWAEWQGQTMAAMRGNIDVQKLAENLAKDQLREKEKRG